MDPHIKSAIALKNLLDHPKRDVAPHRQATLTFDQPVFDQFPGLELKLYHVQVKRQGVHVADHIVEAPDALSAINLVENAYGDPVRLEKSLLEDEGGHRHQIMLASNWHGYMFEAWAIEPAA